MLREEKIIGAVDIGGSEIAVGAVTKEGVIITRLGCATAPEEGFGRAIQQIKGMLREAAARAGAEFEGISVACPGPLDPYTGLVGGRTSGNLLGGNSPDGLG
jgi:predicted NBD/HSP70 family sugar kinase